MPEKHGAMVNKIPSAARQAVIRDRFAQQPGISISELAREFGVSEMTIRRDLDALEEKSQIQRTHGGAMLTERMMFEFDYRERRERNRAEKCAIAAEARKLVKPGQRLILCAHGAHCFIHDGVQQLVMIGPGLLLYEFAHPFSGSGIVRKCETAFLSGQLRQLFDDIEEGRFIPSAEQPGVMNRRCDNLIERVSLRIRLNFRIRRDL